LNKVDLTVIYEDEKPVRLDKYLSSLKKDELHSRSLIEKLILTEKITVNGINEKKKYLLEKGDKIEITLPEPVSSELIPQNIPLEIVYEDEYLAVINKPVGLVVHPGHGNRDGTLVNALLYHFGDNLSNGGGSVRPGIVHRLDKGTSGLLIIAKNDLVHAKLSDMFRLKQVKKRYKAIVIGHPKEKSGTFESNIDRSKNNPLKMVVAPEGRLSITHYKIIKYYYYFCLVDVGLETGRTHQIRVHFSNNNTPVIGDRVYSSFEEVANRIPFNFKKRLRKLFDETLINQALHAYKLEFTHPITNELISVESKLPGYFNKTLSWLDTNFLVEE